MLTIDRTLNSIWRVPKPRPIAQRVLVYWGALTLGPLMLGVSMSVTALALSVSRGLVNATPGAVGVVLETIQFLLLAAGVTGLFHYVPNTHVRWQHAAAGGLFVAVGFELAKKGLAWYVSSVPGIAVIYGAFATVPILLLWIYLGWVIVLLGAVIAAYAPSLQMRVVHLPDSAGQRLTLAVRVLREMVRVRGLGTPGLSLLQLARAIQVDPLQIEPALAQLMRSTGWPHWTRPASNARCCCASRSEPWPNPCSMSCFCGRQPQPQPCAATLASRR